MREKYLPAWPALFSLSITVMLTLVGFFWMYRSSRVEIQIDFLDVGQGDSTLITSPSGRQVLVDGGRAGAANSPLSERLPFYDRSLDVVMATHADSDHIAGLVDILENYRVDTVILPSQPGDSASYQALLTAVQKEQAAGATVRTAARGDVLDIGGGAYLLVQFPPRSAHPQDSNDSSLVFSLRYGSTSFLFTGDSPQAIERLITRSDSSWLRADVLKVGHHGSDTSSDSAFLAAVAPLHTVISAGVNNRYGHPTDEVLARLKSVGAQIHCTCESGTISFVSDGYQVRER